MSSRALDAAAGLSAGHTRLIEAGKRTHLQQQTLASLARALGVSLDWLVNGEGDGPTQSAS